MSTPQILTFAIGFLGLLSTVGVAVFTQVYQGRREDRRASQTAADRRTERWLETRQAVYADFLRGADSIDRGFRARWHLMRYSEKPAPGDDDGAPPGAMEGLAACADALGVMRLVAPDNVTIHARAYLEEVRFIERFVGDRYALMEPGTFMEHPHEGFEETFANIEHHATELLRAMRADLGADESEMVGLGTVDPEIYGC